MTRVALSVAVCVFAAAAGAGADEPQVDVSASCEHRATKGRVLCDVEIESARARIAWADVLVVSAPGFAPPLRSRVGIADARSRTDHRVRIPVAFVATEQARGTVTLRGRAVVCETTGASTCVPVVRTTSVELAVGPDVVH
ncbi:MAG TPA: hypothetical protein VH142_23890 [Polyangiaceae bacterium]|nr:hypothetical protein [Polyangiaceae bacterium]